MATISNGTTTITPTLVLGYESRAESRTVVHRIVGRPDPDVSLDDDGLREGELALFFAGRADAWAAFDALAVAGVWHLTDVDNPETGMSFVRAGRKSIRLDPETRRRWVVTVGYQEVAG